MKTLINIPAITMIGGVSQIYRVLELNKIENIDYFSIMEEKEVSKVSKVKRLVIKYIKYFMTLKKYDIVILNPSFIKNAFFRDSLYCAIARIFNKKIIVFWHGWEDSFEEEVKKTWWKKKLFLVTYAYADKTLVLGTIFKNKLKSLGSNKTNYISTTSIADDTDIKHFDIKQKFYNQSKKENIDILFLSRIEIEKGIYIAIDTINEINKTYKDNCILHIAGSGSELNKTKEYVARNKITNIVFHGFITGIEKFRLLESTDICFLPSYSEGLPSSILESMLYAQPIISRSTGGISDLIKNGNNGFLSEGKHYTDFLPFIEYFIENQSEIKRVGLINHKKAKESFTAEKVKEKYLGIIESI